MSAAARLGATGIVGYRSWPPVYKDQARGDHAGGFITITFVDSPEIQARQSMPGT